MKTFFTFSVIFFCAILFTGCTKNSEVPLSKEEQIAKYLTGAGNKYWHLKKVYTNNVEQTLTDRQRQYTKTYTIGIGETKKGTFTNSDGYTGTWFIRSEFEMHEEFDATTPAGYIPLDYTILSINETMLDIKYTANGIQTREVYYAY